MGVRYKKIYLIECDECQDWNLGFELDITTQKEAAGYVRDHKRIHDEEGN